MESFFEKFKKMAEENRLPYVLLFHGDKHSKKKEAAMQCAQELLQTEKVEHPDLHQYYPEGKMGLHSLQAIKNLCREIYLSSHTGGYKCFIIHHAEKMAPSHANALLKTFEEPPEKSIVFLLTERPGLLLPTIRSRSQSYAFHSSEKNKWNEVQVQLLEVMAGKKGYHELQELCDGLDKERKQEESEGAKALNKEIGVVHREMMVKEIEGRSTIAYQEKREELFGALLAFYRDLTFFHLGATAQQLYFPHFIDVYKKREPQELAEVTKRIALARKGHERGLKLHTCLESLL